MAKRKTPPPRHPLNAEGDFYVAAECCTACDVPQVVAPDLFAYDGDMACYVKKQPSTPDELFRMLRTFAEQDIGCIRYGGTEPSVLERLSSLGEAYACDEPAPQDAELTLRDLVTFTVSEGGPRQLEALCRDYADWLRDGESAGSRYEIVGPTRDAADSVVMSFAWFENNHHRLRWSRLADDAFSLQYLGGSERSVPTLSDVRYDWTVSRPFVAHPRWHVASEWRPGAAGEELPW